MNLHPTLARDTVEVARLPLCRVLLMKDCRFPWLILVPEREAVREIHELSAADRTELIEEIARAGEVLNWLFQPDKLNVGALGNVVPQLHVRRRPVLDRSGVARTGVGLGGCGSLRG